MSGSVTADALTAALIQRGALDPGAVPPSFAGSERPWFVSALLGVAGWLAGLSVLVFVLALFEPSRTSTYATFAAVLLAAAFGLYAADRHNAFFDQLALALSIAGQIAATAAFAQATRSVALTAGAVAVMQCVLLLVMPNRLARSIAAFFACVAWALAIRFAWWDEASWSSRRPAVTPGPAIAGWFVIWAPIAALVSTAIASEPKWMASKARQIARPALTGMLLALTFGTFASMPVDVIELALGPNPEPHTNWLVIWPLLNAAAALLAGLGAFRLRSRAVLGAAIVAALLHVMQFYYVLGTTLVVKSAIMLIVGALLLGWGALLSRGAREREATA